jgi:hypothetical protein
VTRRSMTAGRIGLSARGFALAAGPGRGAGAKGARSRVMSQFQWSFFR